MQKNSKIKVILTGASGQVGFAIQKILKLNKQIEIKVFDSNQLDITKADQIEKLCKSFDADYFINAAAYTKVDLAETESDLAFAINHEALIQICKSCNQHKIHLIHFSSDYVYDSISDRPIAETDPCSPKSIYAKSKLAGDNHIMLNCDQYTILRTSWVYGPNGKNFVNTMLKLGQNKKQLDIVNDQIGTPTYTLDLAMVVSQLIEKAYPDRGDYFTGLYNYSNAGQTNWATFAKKVFEINNLQVDIRPISTEEFAAKAPRPAWSVLSKNKIITKLDVVVNSWESRLFDYLRNYS